MKRFLIAVLASLGLVLFGSTMAAQAAVGDSETVTTTLADRPDSAVGGGTWALDQLERTIVVTEAEAIDDETSLYEAVLTDTGSFETQALDHTPAGAAQELPAGITGSVNGMAHYLVVAASDFDTFNADGVSSETSTGDWAKALFTDGAYADGNDFGDTWSWKYSTGCETWVNQADALGGNSGDITSFCATPEAPTLTEATCDALAELSIPEVEGVVYSHESGTVNPGTLTVTASPAEGYVFADDAVTEWSFTVDAVPGCPGKDGKDGVGTDGKDGQDGDDAQSAGNGDDNVSGGAGGELPDTGSNTGLMAALGSGLALLGGGFVAVRRHLLH